MARVTIDTSQTWGAGQCELAHLGGCSKGTIYRHHMGNDGLLKLACKAIRDTYYQYLDCAKICDRHHMKVHWTYHCRKGEPALRFMTQQQIQALRADYIGIFFGIKAGTIKLEKVPKHFRSKWKTSHKRWQKNRAAKK